MELNKQFLSGATQYTALNLVDKGLALITPVCILFILNDQSVYNLVEYVYAIAAIVVIFLDLGFKHYIMYGLKLTHEKNNSIESYLKQADTLFYQINILMLVALAIILAFTNSLIENPLIFILVLVRAFTLSISQYYAILFRAKDKPNFTFLFSSFGNIGIIISLLMFPFVGLSADKLYFLVPFLMVFGVFCAKILTLKSSYNIDFLKSAYYFSWPILLNSGLAILVLSFAKIFAFNLLSPSDMTELSLVQRASLAIQLVHTSIVGFTLKQVYTSDKNLFSSFYPYFYFLCLSSVAIFLMLSGYVVNHLGYYSFNLLAAGYLIIYTFLWCCSAFFEILFAKHHFTKSILFATLVGVLVFVLIIIVSNSLSLVDLTRTMAISSATTLACMLILYIKQIAPLEKNLS